MWHRLLIFLGWRNELDWTPPGLGPEVNHPYREYERLPCCVHCGGGKRHPIHREPFNARRLAEIADIDARRLAEIEALPSVPIKVPRLGPDGRELNHPYFRHAHLTCCEHCGEGPKHVIHQQPWDKQRTAEILGEFQVLAEQADAGRPAPTDAEVQERADLVAEFRETHQSSKLPYIERED